MEPLEASTPTILKLAEPSLIVCPSGFWLDVKRSDATVWPITTTRFRLVTSCVVIGLPASTV